LFGEDARDAEHLARLLRLDEITPVAVPGVEQEAARDLVRPREDARADVMRARHRLSKLLLRHGIVYSGGAAWNGPHDVWLRSHARGQLASAATRAAFDADYDAVLMVTARRDRLDQQIQQMAGDSEFTPVVRRLGCLRGIGTLSGFALAVELGDWLRFTGRTIGVRPLRDRTMGLPGLRRVWPRRRVSAPNDTLDTSELQGCPLRASEREHTRQISPGNARSALHQPAQRPLNRSSSRTARSGSEADVSRRREYPQAQAILKFGAMLHLAHLLIQGHNTARALVLSVFFRRSKGNNQNAPPFVSWITRTSLGRAVLPTCSTRQPCLSLLSFR
jgi:hypothetical protein